MKSKFFSLLFLAGMLCFIGGTALADTIIIDGKTLDVEPVNVDGRLLVPIGYIASSFNASVSYEPTAQMILIRRPDVVINLTIGNSQAMVNAYPIDLGVPAQIFNDRTYVPLSFISTAFGCSVSWDEQTRTATITSPATTEPADTLKQNEIDQKLVVSQYIEKLNDVVQEMDKGWDQASESYLKYNAPAQGVLATFEHSYQELDPKIRELSSCPEGYEKAYDKLLDLYAVYYQLGTLISTSSGVNNETISAYNVLVTKWNGCVNEIDVAINFAN